jgi:hypothetical protein
MKKSKQKIVIKLDKISKRYDDEAGFEVPIKNTPSLWGIL